MSLPSKCLYQNKINASFARNFNSVIQSQSMNYSCGQTCVINIPTQRNQFLSGADTMLSMKLKIANLSGAASNAVLNRCGIGSCIQRLRIFSGSTLLQDIDSYGNLLSMLTSYQLSTEHVKGKYALMAGTADGLKGMTLMANLANNGTVTVDFCFPLLSILSLTDNYVPMWALAGSGPLRLEIQFVPSFAAFICSSELVSNHTDGHCFGDVKLIANFVEVSDAGMDIIYKSLGDKPVQWVTSSYANYAFNATLQQAVTNVSMPVPAKYNSLKALYFTFRGNPDGADDRFSDDSPNYRIAQYTTRIGSRVVPSEPPTTIPQMVGELERALGCASSRISPSCYVPSQITRDVPITDRSQSSCFAVGVETESYSSAALGSVYQGLNTSTDDIFWQGQFAAQAAVATVRIDAYAFFDQLITIDNGMVSVQY